MVAIEQPVEQILQPLVAISGLWLSFCRGNRNFTRQINSLMAFVFRDWLATTESLPLEGIGLLHWERRSAYVSESDSIVYPAQWSLCLSVNAGTQAPDTLFERLSCFSRLPVLEIKQQYHSWLSTVKSDQVATDVFGFGTLSKGNSPEWNWAATSLPTMPSVSLSGLP